MAERPILFSSAMVKAILAGQKVQTRRPVKPQPVYGYTLHGGEALPLDGEGCAIGDKDRRVRCPFGVPGDRLWVRETWASPEADKTLPGRVAYDADGLCGCWIGSGEDRDFIYHGRILEATGYRECFPKNGSDTYGLGKYSDIRSGEYPSYRYGWRPSIHMPRWASRIALEITNVRVGRLQEISEEDALAEGCVTEPTDDTGLGPGVFTAKLDFAVRWDAIYEKTYPWGANPWVWVVSFKRAEATN